MDGTEPKELEWIASSRRDMQAFPLTVRRVFGYALYAAQCGETPPEAKPLKGFGGAGVLELIEDHRGDTYRAVYTVRFAKKFTCCTYFKKRQSTASLPRNGK
jgi:phage-related protein